MKHDAVGRSTQCNAATICGGEVATWHGAVDAAPSWLEVGQPCNKTLSEIFA